MPEKWELQQMKSLPLSAKIVKTQMRIREFYEHFEGQVYVSFSGGKDSTVLANLVHDLYPDVPLVFSNTGLEYPEIQKFARENGAVFVRPKKTFSEVVSTLGYPIISKRVAANIKTARIVRNIGGGISEEEKKAEDGLPTRRGQLMGANTKLYDGKKWRALCETASFVIGSDCCDVLKKNPIKEYKKREKRAPIIGTLTDESIWREGAWLKTGCNSFSKRDAHSQPMSFWTEQDVLRFISENNVKIASVYGDVVAVDENGYEYNPITCVGCKLKCTGCERTGCIFCGFGAHRESGETRFQRLAKTHPRQYEYCIGGGQWVDNPKFDPTIPKYDGNWTNWNPRKIWVPSKEGLGMKYVFDVCNEINQRGFIRYE